MMGGSIAAWSTALAPHDSWHSEVRERRAREATTDARDVRTASGARKGL